MSMIVDGTAGLTFNNSTTQASAGVVLQVVQSVKTDTYSSTATSWTDVTGVSVSITPKFATSKILVTLNWSVGTNSTNTEDFMARLVRNSTAIAIGDNGGTDNVSKMPLSGSQNNYITFDNSITYLDSPATTSATIYKLQMRNWTTASTYFVGRRGLNTSFIIPSFITVMEIAA